jgi:predicted cobalt transporter CbtA
MTPGMRPLSVTVLAFVYIAVGSIGFVSHFPGIHAIDVLRYDSFWIEIVEVLAIICGAFMLRGQNWARWLAIAWMALHVVLSAFHTLPELAIHSLFCGVIAWLLFRPAAVRYFRPGEPPASTGTNGGT